MADDAKSNERGLVFGLVVVVLLLCVGTPAYVFYRQWADPRTKSAMTEATTAYLNALQADDYAGAYRWVCERDRKKWPLDEWAGYHDTPDIASFTITEADIQDNSEGPTTYQVEAELRDAGGKVQLWSYSLYDESDGWRICHETPISPHR